MSDQQARQTPIIDLLRDIPADARMVYEVTSTHHQSIPVGVLAKQAADEIERLTAERDDLRTLVSLLEGMADAKPERWIVRKHCDDLFSNEHEARRYAQIIGNAEVIPLYAHPAPQPIPEGWKLVKDCTREERSWPEDYSQENGNYFLTCNHCGREFTGHKRRVTCKVCANISEPQPEHRRCWTGPGHLEQTGYIPEGSAAEREAHPALTDSMRREIARAVDVAVNPPGMSVHDGKARIDASLLLRMLAIIDAPQPQPTRSDEPKSETPDALDALCALGVIGGGYCFCSHDRDPDKADHQPECADARAVIEARGQPEPIDAQIEKDRSDE